VPIKLTPGARLRSAVCTAEIVVVRAPTDEVDLRIGGKPVLTSDQPPGEALGPVPPFDSGSQVGKRYAAEGLEVLCTKSGPGSVSVGKRPLEVKQAKPLPSSD